MSTLISAMLVPKCRMKSILSDVDICFNFWGSYSITMIRFFFPQCSTTYRSETNGIAQKIEVVITLSTAPHFVVQEIVERVW